MSKKPWKIEYSDEPWFSSIGNHKGEGVGFYKILFNDLMYGSISKDAWLEKSTGEILNLVEFMLNDAHHLAIKDKDNVDVMG
jgi:hypothetical protein